MPTFPSNIVSAIAYSSTIYEENAIQLNYYDNGMQISEDGKTIAVGDPSYDSGTGLVYIYSRSGAGGGWIKTQTLTWTQQTASSNFGVSVALSGDANTLVVGSVSNSVNAAHGRAVVYTRDASTGLYSESQTIIVSTIYADAGHYVYISSDGSTIVFASQNETGSQSTLYVYTKPSTWTQQTTIQSTFYPSLGSTLVISADGNTIAAYRNEDNVVVYFRSGSAYTVQSTRTIGGPTISASRSAGITTIRTTDSLDTELSIGDLVIVSDIVPTSYRTPTTGSVVTNLTSVSPFRVSYASAAGTGTQTTAGTVTAPSLRTARPLSAGQYGTSMSISYDGNKLAISETDRVYLYTRSAGAWILAYTYIDPTGISTSYGTSGALAISSDGSNLFIYDTYGYIGPGQNRPIYVYSTTSTTLLYTYYLSTDDYDYPVSSAIKASINGGTIIANDSARSIFIFDTGRYLDNNLYGHNGKNDVWTISRFGELTSPTTHLINTSRTFTIPSGAKVIKVTCFGAGGGGGGGARNSTNTYSGGGGGAGGAMSNYLFRAQDLGDSGASITVTVGTGGTGGAVTATGTTALAGNSGSTGGTSSISLNLPIKNIQSIATGVNPLITVDSAHNFSINDSVTLSGTTSGTYNGTFSILSVPSATTFRIVSTLTTGQVAAVGTASSTRIFLQATGGGGGSGGVITGSNSSGFNGIGMFCGNGSGNGFSFVSSSSGSGQGGRGASSGAGASGGVPSASNLTAATGSVSANGSDGPSNPYYEVGGGGAGGASNTTNGFNGGLGGLYGGGGGGGGASTTSASGFGGAGGTGGDGFVIITVWYG